MHALNAAAESKCEDMADIEDMVQLNIAESISIYTLCGELKAHLNSPDSGAFDFIDANAKRDKRRRQAFERERSLRPTAGMSDSDSSDSDSSSDDGGDDDDNGQWTTMYNGEDDNDGFGGGSFARRGGGLSKNLEAGKNIQNDVQSVEVVWLGHCSKIYFTLPLEWNGLSTRTKASFLARVDYSSHELRMKALLAEHSDFHHEMQHIFLWKKSPMVSFDGFVVFREKKNCRGRTRTRTLNV